jgi:hypothetical protein
MNAQQSWKQNWQWRYGFLVLLLVLLVWNLSDSSQGLRSQAAGRFSNLIILLMLIFNHIAFSCIPIGRFKTAFRMFSYAWVIFGCVYVFTRGFSGFLFW